MAETLKVYNKENKTLKIIATVACVVFLVLAFAVSGLLIFQKTYYTPFWVHGQSMYPTLNSNAKYLDDDTLIGERLTSNNASLKDVDYGFMATDKSSLNNIKRFDIVIVKYYEYQQSQNIKRIIAMPGETFFITSSDDNSNGQLFVYNDDINNYKLVEQPIDSYYLINGNYPVKYSNPTTLKDDEYFLMGDNRIASNSYDSRSVGPIKKDLILGIARGLHGYATVEYENDNYQITHISKYWPRFF